MYSATTHRFTDVPSTVYVYVISMFSHDETTLLYTCIICFVILFVLDCLFG